MSEEIVLPTGPGPRGNIIVVDDDSEMRSLLEDYLRHQGYWVKSFSDAESAFRDLSEHIDFTGEIIISDIQMPQLSGLQFLEKVKATHPEMPVILMTAYGSIESAIDAIKKGAFDYLTKPFKLSEVNLVIERALNFSRLSQENKQLRQDLNKKYFKGDLIGKSFLMQQLFDLIDRVSQVTANVLISGETGSGKEVVARAIHHLGPRNQAPFIAVNCTSIPESLLESELFGHKQGAHAEASENKIGLFETANGGTLFLEEIGNLDVGLQAKLLRVLQDRKIRPLGETSDRPIDVRVIASTNKDLKLAIKEGLFREDLYFRLAVIPIHVPPLRHRKEDIPLLANYFVNKYATRNGVHIAGFKKGALQELINMRWDGNVRELENIVERLVVMCKHEYIEESDIPLQEMQNIEEFWNSTTRDLPSMEQLEKRYIQLVLERVGGKKDKAAQILGMNRRTLYRKEREYGLVDDAHEFLDLN